MAGIKLQVGTKYSPRNLETFMNFYHSEGMEMKSCKQIIGRTRLLMARWSEDFCLGHCLLPFNHNNGGVKITRSKKMAPVPENGQDRKHPTTSQASKRREIIGHTCIGSLITALATKGVSTNYKSRHIQKRSSREELAEDVLGGGFRWPQQQSKESKGGGVRIH